MVALFGVFFVTRQIYYRYAGLAVFVPALVRLFFRDTRELEGGNRVAARIGLGVVLLAAVLGYVRAKEHLAGPRSVDGTKD